MVIGEKFAWAHIGKTGGDATHKLFSFVPDLIIENDLFKGEKTEQGKLVGIKHDTFQHRGIKNKLLLLNIRKLPSWVLSWAFHQLIYKPLASKNYSCRFTKYILEHNELPPDLCETTWGDDQIMRYTDNGNLRIDRWFRMENLREDLIDFLSTIRKITDKERASILNSPTKSSMNYNHDIKNYFTKSQIKTLYEHNPLWAQVEYEYYRN